MNEGQGTVNLRAQKVLCWPLKSPPFEGGVAAPPRKCARSLNGADGVVRSVSRVLNMPRTSEHLGFENRTLLRNAEWVLETIKRELLAREQR